EKKITAALACARSNTTASGMTGSSRYGQPDPLRRNRPTSKEVPALTAGSLRKRAGRRGGGRRHAPDGARAGDDAARAVAARRQGERRSAHLRAFVASLPAFATHCEYFCRFFEFGAAAEPDPELELEPSPSPPSCP